jgi:pSer/pThr/pTyr-binding forkhead associated (FHA) protein
MYLKVDNNGEEQLYSFENQTNVIIGRAPSSDIQVVTDGISRKHLEVIEKEGEYFVIDYGSTNGTFLNDERLEPNVEHPFNSFFPLKLGFHVYLYLVDEVSSEQLQEAITTTQAPHEDTKPETVSTPRKAKVQSSGTGSASLKVKNQKTSATAGMKPRERNRKKSARKKEEEDKLNIPLYAAVFLLVMAGIAYSQGMLDSFIGTQEPMQPVAQQKPKPRKKPKKAAPQKPKSLIPSKKDISSKMILDKCLTDEERKLCDGMSSHYKKDYNEGFSILVDKAYLILSYDKIKEYYAGKTVNEEEREELISLAKTSMGRTFNRDLFVKNNYKGNHFNDTEEDQLIFFLFDIIRGRYFYILKNLKLKNITYILYQGNQIREPYIYASFETDKLKELIENETLFKYLRYSIFANESIIFKRALYSTLKGVNTKSFLPNVKVFK